MKFYRTTTVFEDPWETVTLAFWRKYHPGNPYVSHVEGTAAGGPCAHGLWADHARTGEPCEHRPRAQRL